MYDLKYDADNDKWVLTDKRDRKTCELETQGGNDTELVVAWLLVNTGNSGKVGVPTRVR